MHTHQNGVKQSISVPTRGMELAWFCFGYKTLPYLPCAYFATNPSIVLLETCLLFSSKHLQLHPSNFLRRNSRFQHQAVSSHQHRFRRLESFVLIFALVSSNTLSHRFIGTSLVSFHRNHVLLHPSPFSIFLHVALSPPISFLLTFWLLSQPFQASSVRPNITDLLNILQPPASFYSSALSTHNYFFLSPFPSRALNTVVISRFTTSTCIYSSPLYQPIPLAITSSFKKSNSNAQISLRHATTTTNAGHPCYNLSF